MDFSRFQRLSPPLRQFPTSRFQRIILVFESIFFCFNTFFKAFWQAFVGQSAPYPLIFAKVNVAVFVHFNAVRTEQICLHFRSSEGKCRGAFSKAIYHSKARDMFGIGVKMQRISHRSRSARRAAKARNLSVGRHLSAWYFLDLSIYDIIKTHSAYIDKNGGFYSHCADINCRLCVLLLYYATLYKKLFKHFGGVSAHLCARARAIVFGSASVGSRIGGGSCTENFTTDDRAVYLFKPSCKLLYSGIMLRLFRLRVGQIRIGITFEQAFHDKHAAHRSAHFSEPSHAAAKGRAKHKNPFAFKARDIRKGEHHRLRAAVSVNKILFCNFTSCHISFRLRQAQV